MGYYTRYKLKVSKEPEGLAERFNKTADYGESFYEHLVSGNEDSVKWYEHDENMRAVSKEYPDILFTLYGEGEESGDIWVKYYKNGKSQVANAQIKFDEFDPKKLT